MAFYSELGYNIQLRNIWEDYYFLEEVIKFS